MKRTKVAVIFGTRPEAIKLAPVILGMRSDRSFACHVCVTAQHRQMLDQVLDVFGIVPDTDLDLMERDQSLGGFTSRAIRELDAFVASTRPDMILVQGDTTTVFCAALAAFYHRVPVGHVEAGLRTGNLEAPWPEEANRVLTTRLAALHFAPTTASRKNLLEEGIPRDRIHVTGNTVIDALFLALEKVRACPPPVPGLDRSIMDSIQKEPVVLITGHRRESFGKGLKSICTAIARLSRRHPDVHFVYPVHMNPNVRQTVHHILGGTKRGNVHLINPLPYLPFVRLMDRSKLILTDSGGIQEEAPSLGKPVLVMRETTERPEGVKAGTAKLVGTDPEAIFRETSRLLSDCNAYDAMARPRNPYGDGKATGRILMACRRLFGHSTF